MPTTRLSLEAISRILTIQHVSTPDERVLHWHVLTHEPLSSIVSEGWFRDTSRARRPRSLPQFQAARRPATLPPRHKASCARGLVRLDCRRSVARGVDCMAQWRRGGWEVCHMSIPCGDMYPAGHQGRKFLLLPFRSHAKYNRSSHRYPCISDHPALPRN